MDADIAAHLDAYPTIQTPDPDIDFRRVKNLDTFFSGMQRSSPQTFPILPPGSLGISSCMQDTSPSYLTGGTKKACRISFTMPGSQSMKRMPSSGIRFLPIIGGHPTRHKSWLHHPHFSRARFHSATRCYAALQL